MSDLVAKLGVDATGWNKGFQQAKSTASSFASGFIGLVGPIGGALAAAWGAAESVAGFKDSLAAQRKLSAVLEATGGAAGLTTDEIADFSSKMQTLTNFEDDATTGAAAVLAAFTNIRGQTFTDTIESAMDMSTVMGGELTDNVKLLGKALNDPIDGVKKLSKAGVQLTQEQENQITAMQKSGDLLGAQEVLLGALQDRFGGAAQAVADPWTQLTNVIGDVGENIGAVLLPTINVVSEAVTGWLGPVASAGDSFLELGATVAANVQVGIDLVTQFGQTLATVVSSGAQIASDAFGSFLEMVGLGGMTFQNAVSAVMVYYSHTTEIFDLLVVGVQLMAVRVGAELMHLFTVVGPAYITWFDENWQDIFVTLASNTLTIFENIVTNIGSAWTTLLEFFKTGKLEFNWTPLTQGFVNTVKELPKIADREMGPLEQSLSDEFSAKSMALGDSMAAQFASLESNVAAKRESIMQKFDTSSKIPAGPIADAEGKNHDTGKGKKSNAALAGSKEAASVFLTGLGTNKDDTPKKIDQSNQYLKTIAEAAKKNPQNGNQGQLLVANFGRP